MTDQVLRKLSRAELLEMLIEEGRENLRLREKLAETERELEEAGRGDLRPFQSVRFFVRGAVHAAEM